MMDQLLLRVWTRGYAASLEVAPAGARSRATSKSAVSRRLVTATRRQLEAQLGRRLDELDLVALFLDGLHVASQTLLVALGVAADGSKTPLGIRLGSTENAAICTELLQDLVSRGLRLDGRLLCVIDGGKGVRKALEDVLGTGSKHVGKPALRNYRNEWITGTLKPGTVQAVVTFGGLARTAWTAFTTIHLPERCHYRASHPSDFSGVCWRHEGREGSQHKEDATPMERHLGAPPSGSIGEECADNSAGPVWRCLRGYG
jgi:hypothetical protein